MGDRVVHRVGDALADDLGNDAYDAVLIAQVVHHFSEPQNRDLAARVARALRPGGLADWQRRAGLEPRRTIRFRTAPGIGVQAAVKPG